MRTATAGVLAVAVAVAVAAVSGLDGQEIRLVLAVAVIQLRLVGGFLNSYKEEHASGIR